LATIASYDRGATLFSARTTDRSFAAGLYQRCVELAPGRALLDLGSGPAHDGAELARRGFLVTACDPTRGLLVEAQSHAMLRGRLVLGDARELPFRAGSFDAIWACASLLHIPKPQVRRSLAEALRILRQDGLLFTSMQEGVSEDMVAVGESDALPDRFYAYYRAEEWISLLEGAGFKLLEQRLKRTTDHVNAGATGWIETFARRS
jgi:ubiquinone/menaquinone biosynthesis C-methylase UbiE